MPDRFRELLLLSQDDPRPFCDIVQPWQVDDFRTIDPGWQALAGVAAKRSPSAQHVLKRAYIERPRGHSKTSDTAMQVAWILLASPRPLVGLAAAADREQASLIHTAIHRLAKFNPRHCERLSFIKHQVINRETGSRLEIISSDVASSWGALPDFVVCDELCHWSKPDLWYSLLSSAAKRPDGVLIVLTNAGVGRDWQWQVREAARTSPQWHFSSLEGPQAPWITDEWLTEQRRLLPPPVYERLWLNRWQHSDGEFVTLAEAEACRDDQLTYQHKGRTGIEYIAAIDFAEKHDDTVGCVCHRDGERIIIDRMDVQRPTAQTPTPVQWVEDWITEVARRFGKVTFVVDEYQLLGVIQRLEHRYDIRRFEFAAGKGNHELALALRQLILERQVGWYPHCGQIQGGQIESPGERNDLETELASLLIVQQASGRVRIDHRSTAGYHDDRAFALGVASVHLLRRPTGHGLLNIASPMLTSPPGW